MKKKVTIRNTIPFITFFCFLIMLLIFALRNTLNLDNLSLLIVFFLMICLFYYKSQIFIKYVFSIFTCLFMIIGLYLCNKNGIYLYEIEKYSHYNGSFSIAVIYFIIYFVFLILFDSFFEKKFKYFYESEKNNNYNFFLILMFLIELVSFMSVINKPSFLLNVDRFGYSKYFLNPIISKIQSIFICLSPALLLPFFKKNKKSKKQIIFIILIILILFFLYGVWTGNKFGLFFNIFYLIFSPLAVLLGNKGLKENEYRCLKIEENNLIKFKFNIIKIISFAFIILLVTIAPYYVLRNIEFSSGLLKRTAQQGQLWWATYDLMHNNEKHISEISDEIEAIKILDFSDSKNYNYSYGVYKIMKLVTPNYIYSNVINNGYRYSAQGIEISYYYFRYFGIIVHSILRAFFEALLVNLLIKYLFSKRLLEMIITSKFIIIFHSAFSQGDIYLLFSKSTIIMFMMLIFLEMMYKKKIKEENNENISHYTC